MTFGELLKSKRIQKGLTQKELADSVFSTVAAISQFEHDKHMPKTDMIYSFAEVLCVPVEILLFTGADVIRDIELSEEFLESDATMEIFGYTPDKISITDVAEHKYRSMKVWNPDYTPEQFFVDVLYPYIKNNPQEIDNLLKAYGQKDSTSENNEKETATMSLSENELMLSKTVRKNIYDNKNNTLIFANPRSGLHTKLLIPNIVTMDTNFVITDINGEMYNMTQKILKEKGYNVKVLNITGRETPFVEEDDLIRYHPLRNCNCLADVSEFVDSILSVLNRDKYDVAHRELLRGYLEGCINFMRDHHSKKEWSIKTLLDILVKVKNEETGYKLLNIITDDLYNEIVIMLNAFVSNIINEQMDNEFDMDVFMRNGRYAIFVYTNWYNEYSNIMNRVFMQQFISREEKLNNIRNTTYVLDELENLPVLPWLPKYMALGHNRVFLCTTHTIEGVKYRYGDAAAHMVMNYNNIVCMGTHDVRTAEFLSETSGTNRLDKPKRTRFTDTIYERPIIEMNRIMTMKNDECIVMCQGAKAIVDKVYDAE